MCSRFPLLFLAQSVSYIRFRENMFEWNNFPQPVRLLILEIKDTKGNTNKHLQADSFPPQCQLKHNPIGWPACWPHTRLSAGQYLCLSFFSTRVSLPLTCKPADDARCTRNPPFGSYHTDTQGSPSVGQWKTVAMAAHREPCCRMIWGVMLLNQPPFSALHCCLYAAI